MTDPGPAPVRYVRSKAYGNIPVEAVRRQCDCGRGFWAWPETYQVTTDRGHTIERPLKSTTDQYRCSHCLAEQATRAKVDTNRYD